MNATEWGGALSGDSQQAEVVAALQAVRELLEAQQSVLTDLTQATRTLTETQASLSEHLNRVGFRDDTIVEVLAGVQRSVDIIRDATLAPAFDGARNFLERNQLSLKDTLLRLVETECSFARIGDGELKMIVSPWRGLAFQANSLDLLADLEDVVRAGVPGLMVGLPQFMRNENYMKLWPAVWGHLRTLVDPDAEYGNSHVSRPLGFKFLGEGSIRLWRQVWFGKSVRVITGRGSRFEVLPILFDTAKHVDIFESLPRDAYADLERILSEAVVGAPDIFVISLGPAGTILAKELAARGYRALDVGHLSSSYRNIFEGAVPPEHTPLERD